MDLPSEMWMHIVDYAIHSLREDFERGAREWEAHARQIDEHTPKELLRKLIVIDPTDTQIIPKDKILPENTIVHMKRTNWQLCNLINLTEAWWRRIFSSFYNSDTWYNISRFASYQEALNTLLKVSTSAKRERNKSSLQLLKLPFEYDKIYCMKEGILYYVYQDQILSRSLADLSENPTFVSKHPKWLTANTFIQDIFILPGDMIALELLREGEIEPITSFMNRDGYDLMETVQTICYYDEDLVMLEWWDERTVYKLPDLTECPVSVNLSPLKNTRIVYDWIYIDGVFGYLSRTTGSFVQIAEIGQPTLSKMLKQYPVEERLEARLKSDTAKKFPFYFMNKNTNVFVHDVYAQEKSFTLEVCGVKWAKSTENVVHNVALVKNRLFILMRSDKKRDAPMHLCFVDL